VGGDRRFPGNARKIHISVVGHKPSLSNQVSLESQPNSTSNERSGVEIDYCPRCRGVWLDRGELDKIIERSTMSTSNVDPRDSRAGSFDHTDRPRKPKKKSSFLGDIFDF
jgi:Zn-finger nucleic acid-binding protein